MMRKYVALSCVLLLIGTTLYSRPAAASQNGGTIFIEVVAISADALLLGLGAAPIVMNTYGIAIHERPSQAWEILGFTAGGLNCLVGLLLLIPAFVDHNKYFLGFGIANMSAGGFDLILTPWASSLPEKKSTSRFFPTKLPDGKGGTAWGLGFATTF